jgi:hypothetical protein
MLTDYTYTGQRSEVENFGLMYYNARWFEPELPDTGDLNIYMVDQVTLVTGVLSSGS